MIENNNYDHLFSIFAPDKSGTFLETKVVVFFNDYIQLTKR